MKSSQFIRLPPIPFVCMFVSVNTTLPGLTNQRTSEYYVCMTVHRNRLKWIKPTDALNSNFIGMTTLNVSGSLSAHHQEFWAIYRLWYIICSCGDRMIPGVGWHCHPTPGSIRSPLLHIMYQSRCTAQSSRWCAERLPETGRVVIPIKLELSASVGFIHFNLLRCTVMRTHKKKSSFD